MLQYKYESESRAGICKQSAMRGKREASTLSFRDVMGPVLLY
jgi:hypothetical protein